MTRCDSNNLLKILYKNISTIQPASKRPHFVNFITCNFNKCVNRTVQYLTLTLLVAYFTTQNGAKNPKKWPNPGTWVLIWEYSARAIQWIPTWQGLNGFQKSLRPCALDESNIRIRRVNPFTLRAAKTGLAILKIFCLQKYFLESIWR